MLCAFLIFFWVQHELSFDRYNEKGRNIYRVLQHIRYSEVVIWAINQGPLGPALKEEIPEIAEQARYSFARWRIKYKDEIFADIGGYTDPSLFKMFTLPFVQGNPDTALSDPRSVVLTRELAQKILGSEDPIGKIINVADEYDFRVSGILQDLPDNTHFRFKFLANMNLIFALWMTDWRPCTAENSGWDGSSLCLRAYLFLFPVWAFLDWLLLSNSGYSWGQDW